MSYAPYIAMHRFGLGSHNPSEMRTIAVNPKAWLMRQLDPRNSTALPGTFWDSVSILKKFTAELQAAETPNERREIRKAGQDFYLSEMEARFQFAGTSNTPLIERLVMFWSNHFTVSCIGKKQLSPIMGAYEREAIRPYVLGKFEDMLLAVARHPAMLNYLDNSRSIGPNSMAGSRRNRGLNENLAREIMELHTLGVNGGYTQDDVIAFAKILTGWTVKGRRQGYGGFQFNNSMHEQRSQIFLGNKYDQMGEAKGIAALKDLAAHPATARFIAIKLARHFISDTPSETSISRLEASFQRSGGDLSDVMKTLVAMSEVWESPYTKVKTPYEMMVATYRLGMGSLRGVDYNKIDRSLTLFDHRPFHAPSPAGWPDTAEDWVSPNATMNRVEWCHSVAQVVQPKYNPVDIAKAALGDAASADTLLWIERAPTAVEGFALFLASPEWQRR